MYVRFLVFQKERLRKNVLGAYCIAALKLKVQTYRNRMYFSFGLELFVKQNSRIEATQIPLVRCMYYARTHQLRAYEATLHSLFVINSMNWLHFNVKISRL